MRKWVALLVAGVLCRTADASIPAPKTLHARVLHAQVVLVARCRMVVRSKALAGALHEVQVREVLANWSGIEDFKGYRLDDTIPCTALGARAHVPQKTDVLLFVGIDPVRKRFHIQYACMNCVVPLTGVLDEYPGPQYVAKRMSGRTFLQATRALVRDFMRLEWLEEAQRKAHGSVHPFCANDRGHLASRIASLKRRLSEAHAGWNRWGATDPRLVRAVSGSRPVFEFAGATKPRRTYGVSRRVRIESGWALTLTWRSSVRQHEIRPAPIRVHVRDGKRTLWQEQIEAGSVKGAWDTGEQTWQRTFTVRRPREVELVLSFHDAVGAGGFQFGMVRVDRCEAAEPDERTILLPDG